jgi:hypothetical protein
MMKNIRYLIFVLLMGVVAFYNNCGGNDPEPEWTAQQKAAKILSASVWGGLGKVKVDSPPRPDLDNSHYSGILTLRLTFNVDAQNNPTTFKAEDGNNIFPDFNGNWSWSGTGTNTITISGGGITVLNSFTIVPNQENPGSIRFTFNSPCTACRTSDVSGNYTVTLDR